MPVQDRGSSRTRIGTAVAALVTLPLLGAAPATNPEEAVIRELNAGYVRAFMHADAAWYDRHLTPDFVCIVTSGAVVDRATFLENAKKGPTVESYDLSEVSVRIHGDAALVSALGTWKRKDATVGRTRYVDVWVKKDGTWKAVSAQLTAAAPPA